MSWFDGALAITALCLGAFHLVRLASARSDGRPLGGEAAHAATGFGMAAMFAPGADPLPPQVWAVVFAVSVVWFGAVALRAGFAVDDTAHHIVCGAAMLLMVLHGAAEQPATAPADAEHAHHAMGAMSSTPWMISVVALALAGYFGTHVLRCGQRLATAQPMPGCAHESAGAPTALRLRRLRAPHTAVAAHLVAAAGMSVMFLGMI